MGLIGLLSKAFARAREGADGELQQLLIDAVDAAGNLEQEHRDLRERLAALEAHQRMQADLVFRDAAYWRQDGSDADPRCPTCWDAKKLEVRLHVYGDSYRCLSCDKMWTRPSASGRGPKRIPSPRYF